MDRLAADPVLVLATVWRRTGEEARLRFRWQRSKSEIMAEVLALLGVEFDALPAVWWVVTE